MTNDSQVTQIMIARETPAIDEVVAAYSRGLDCAEALGLVEEQLSLEEAIGKTFLLQGDLIPAAEHFERAMALTSDPFVRARLQTEAASSLTVTGNQRGVEYIHEALKVLDPVKNPFETANALATEARFHHLAGRHRQAIDLLKRAAELIEPIVSAGTVTASAAPMISQVYPFLAGAHQHYGLFEDSTEWARRALEFGERLNISFTQALGFEFLGENAIHLAEYAAGLEYSEREREIVERIHSRERRAWTHFVAAMCSSLSGDFARGEREHREGIALAEVTGERRVGGLLKGSYVMLKSLEGQAAGPETAAGREFLDQALEIGLENFAAAENIGLLYSRFDAHRCLAFAHFHRGELDEAERLCAAGNDLVAESESRVSQLWLGPLYLDVLMALAQKLRSEKKEDEASAKLKLAHELLDRYQVLVTECQSPHFVREAARLAQELRQAAAAS
jgi:tetratricopeptide (TPR) repeat protein